MVDIINSKNKLTILVSVLAIILVIFVSGCSPKEQTETKAQTAAETGAKQTADNNAMVVCEPSADPSCFLNRMNQCLPVTAKMTASDGSSAIDITVLGQVNDTCHFQRKIDGVLNMDCYFPRGTLNMDTLDQTFGNDKGLQSVVDAACKPVGW